jgi:putative hydrolase of the HAD superfamily
LSKPDLRAVIFDAGNTLLFADPVGILEIIGQVGVEADRERFREAEYEARVQLAQQLAEGDRGTESHIWRVYFSTLFLGCGVPEERLEWVGERVLELHVANKLWVHVEPSTFAALESLVDMGLRLAVVSNADGRVESLLTEAGLRPLFEFVLDSFVEGVEKPDPEIFLSACDRLGLSPSECVYVGDLYPVDIVGARAAGLQAILLDPLGRLNYPVERIPSVAHLPDFLLARSG